MYPIAAIFRSPRLPVRKVRSLVSYSTATAVAWPLLSPCPPLSSAVRASTTQLIPSAHSFSGIARSVLSKYPHILEGGKARISADSSLRDLLFEVLDVIPDTGRRFLRVSELKPQDVLQILLGFQAECEKERFLATKVEPLWRIFNWAVEHVEGFEHLPSTYRVMALLLARAGLLREAESLLRNVESRGLVLDNAEILSNLIEEYAGLGELDRAIAVYDRVRRQGLVPLPSCYHALIEILVRRRKTQLAFSICWDMVERCTDKLAGEAKRDIDNVVRLLCGSNRIQEVRNLVKKVTFSDLGWQPCSFILNDITARYCEKKDFEDLLSLYRELRCEPDTVSGNRVVNTLCREFGSKRGDQFLLELEDLGFKPDEVTFGILICWSCNEGNLRSALMYLSESLSRGLKPDIFSYNALICGLFNQGMWRNVDEILNEMVDKGTSPDCTTYRILLAGYCKARQFDLLRNVIDEMQKFYFIQLTSLEDPLSKAFEILGFSPQAVRLKRDSHVGYSRAEFFDSLGNGLYLETDLEVFDSKVDAVLHGSIIPDFNELIMKECTSGNPKLDLLLVSEMSLWGQDLSLPVLSALVKELCLSHSSVKETSRLIEKMPTSFDRLDEVTLDSLARFFCKKRLSRKGMAFLGRMLDRKMTVKNETYTAFLASLCKEEDLIEFRKLWDLARKNKWAPGLDDFKLLLERLCGKKLLPEIVELFERMLMYHPISQVCDVFFEKLCSSGFTTMANRLAKEMELRGRFLDHVAKGHFIRGFCLENNHSEALRIFDSTQVDKLVVATDVLVTLIPSLCLAERSTEAVTLGDFLLKKHPSFSLPVHLALLKGYTEAGNFQEASDLFRDLLSKGICPGVEAYDMIFRGICRSNNLNKVEELLALMVRRNLSLSVSSFRMIVRLMCVQGRLNRVLGLKEFMLGQSNSNGLVIYNILIFHLFMTGKSWVVHSILSEMQAKSFLPDEVTYNFLICGFSHCQDYPSSMHYLSAMMSKEHRPSNRSLRNVIRCLCGVSEFGKVRDLCREMESRGWLHSSTMHNMIVNGLVSGGKIREAEAFADRMSEHRSIPNEVIYDGLIRQLCRQGRVGKAVDLLNVMLKKGSVPNASCYNSLINGFCADNDVDSAMDIHAEMLLRGLTPSIKTTSLMIRKCCEVGGIVEAERLLLSVSQAGQTPTREMYNSVINRYRSENNPRKASELVQAMQQIGYEPDFETHWSLISTLNQSKGEHSKVTNQPGFLSRLLSGSGFSWRTDTKSKRS
ncbi:pentatricopeptide repeat-containing protein At5g15280, mitochondrial [Punica granatum]|uniref:Uncharacterized protein n=2 Tax=Punica granatum TaxID=22663 RepID=A0A218VWH0_PUNGR|nr:pentatricopeptide repeat-containing protein At5g15280, mitochondrial [Punica granatum]OWM64568.1 hypothetical protein CDL15_Pgr020535 [Punica granatum]PKI47898.1 hypothetical protein CRG98_031682 [Punica granatum]